MKDGRVLVRQCQSDTGDTVEAVDCGGAGIHGPCSQGGGGGSWCLGSCLGVVGVGSSYGDRRSSH